MRDSSNDSATTFGVGGSRGTLRRHKAKRSGVGIRPRRVVVETYASVTDLRRRASGTVHGVAPADNLERKFLYAARLIITATTLKRVLASLPGVQAPGR